MQNTGGEQHALDDVAIQEQIEAVFAQQPRVDPRELQVEVKDACVYLSGEVDSTIEKRHARQIAEEIPGVRRVVDNIRVKNFVHYPDDELAELVRHRLQRDPWVEGRIEVYAANGEVRLDGSVPTYHARKSAEDVVWWTPGVIGVENLLLVTDEDFVDVSA